MKKLSAVMSLVSALTLVLCTPSLTRAQDSETPAQSATPSVKSRDTITFKIRADLSTNMCGNGSYLIIDHPFTNKRKNIVFGAVNTWSEDESFIGQFPLPVGFMYFLAPVAGDCPTKKWLMTSVQSGITFVFTATELR
jgi:hypothetical protein